MKYGKHLFLVLVVIFLTAIESSAQVKLPRASQMSALTQTIGVTDVTIKNSRPGVKGREIWGKLVPYDQVWRTGANEATTISFTDTVNIIGGDNVSHMLPAGSYGVATIPSKDKWIIIFHKKPDMEGASGYTQDDDALRITVTPTAGEHQEWMRFSIEDLKENSGKVVFAWEKLQVSFTIETPTHDLVMRSARKTITNQSSQQAANYLLGKKTELDQAMTWIDLSISINETYGNLRVKAQLLEATGKKNDAIKVMEKAITLGAKMADPPFDFEQMKEKLAEWKK